MEQKHDATASAGGAKAEDAHLHVNLRVKNGSTQEEVCFRIKKSMPLKKMMDAYAQRQNLDVRMIK